MSNIKAILCDLDGTILDIKHVHFQALNDALAKISPNHVISYEDHIKYFDGKSTKVKLNILTQTKNLDSALHEKISELKQKFTEIELKKIKPNFRIQGILSKLKEDGFILACCTNSIRKNAELALKMAGYFDYFDFIFTNNDVKNTKPHPEIYLKAFIETQCLPKECLIIEDSYFGKLAAIESGGLVCPVSDSNDFTYEKIISYTRNQSNLIKLNKKWSKTTMNIVIPMAGRGSRFEKAGYTFPKPLIPINSLNGKPMIQVVVENINIEANYIFLVQKEHYEKYNLGYLLNLIAPNCKIIQIDGVTEGAACTVLLAESLINNDTPLIICNSDQYMEWDSSVFMDKMILSGADGGILTFNNSHPKFSYARLDCNNEYVEEVAEKLPISNHATTGLYYIKSGKDFVSSAKKMILQNKRVNNEFYVCPVFNELIKDNKKIISYDVDAFYGPGDPLDLQFFENNFGKK